ncbi:MAG: 3-oxoacyl-[acyl-carrier-protein] synthase-1 [Patiriisocius sp.]|jgi:3-oxoacyl-[acyl-carrier-protein] synthase-1
MTKTYVSYNNIISSLGFTSSTVVDAIQEEQSGLSMIDDPAVFPHPFYASLIDEIKLNSAFSEIQTTLSHTKLEKMMVLSVQDVLLKSGISLTEKTGLIISTTKGNIDVLETESSFPESRSYLSSLGSILQKHFGFKTRPIVVSNACVSGVLAVAVAKRYVQAGRFDNVIITSGDLVTKFILSGFNSFQALSQEPCRPYDINRSGINIGEVAASVLVTNKLNNLAIEAVEIIGDSSCNDANHISGPSRTGEGLYRSINNAMNEAGISSEDIDYISAHGTATSFNDEMESIAFGRLDLNKTPAHSLKGYFGHTLGASGLLETIVGMHSLHRNMLFVSLGFETLGVSQPMNIIKYTTTKKMNTFLKTASGFGGCNTAVLFKKTN